MFVFENGHKLGVKLVTYGLFFRVQVIDLIYEVQLMDSNAKFLEVDWTYVDIPSLDTKNKQEQAARKYWQPEITNPLTTEIVADSDIKIIKRVQP